MDVRKVRKIIKEVFRKNKYVWIVLLIGIILMLIPGKDNGEVDISEKEVCNTQEKTLDTRLENTLCKLKGAGQVEVILSVARGEQIIYQEDKNDSIDENQSNIRTQTILIEDSERNESGLIRQRNPPQYQGAIILAQGADDPSVKLAIVDAVCKVTGLGADKISVLKMQ